MQSIEILRNKLKENKLDIFYLRSLSNIKWVTGFKGVFDTESAHALLISATNAHIHSDARYITALQNAAEDTPLIVNDNRVPHFSYLLSVLETEIKENMQEKKTVRVGIETSISLREYRQIQKLASDSRFEIELVEFDTFVEELRQVKREDELELMKKAQAITDAGFSYICTFIKEGMTEKEVQLELNRFMYDAGADGLAFDTIVATGAHAASPHAMPGETVIKKGDCIVMDFGAKFEGYCSDMTRCVFIGEPNEELRNAWNLLVSVNETCESVIRANESAAEIHNLAEKLLEEGGYGGAMGHSLGHSVGIDVHESPTLSRAERRNLKSGNVVTVEPGIYIAGKFGMRLEDFGVVREDGYEVFTQSSHEMVIIDA